MEGLPISGISPRSNGSKAGDDFIALWNRGVLDDREREQRRRRVLARLDVYKVVPNDGWVKRVDGVPQSVPFDHPYGEYASLKVGERIALGYVGSERDTMAGIYQVTRITRSPLLMHADVQWVRDVDWDRQVESPT
jgi:hypothetical protein